MTSHLSDRLPESIFFCSRVVHRFVKWGVEVVNAVDADGKLKSKVLRNNWTNSPEQQALICPTFPKN